MVDRNARDRLTKLILDTIHSRIELDEYLHWSPRSRDKAIEELYSSLFRLFTDGYFDNGFFASKEDLVKFFLSNGSVRNILLFLGSDLEYEWPPKTNMGFLEKLLWRIGIGFRSKEELVTEAERYRASSDIDVWPFIRRSDLEKAEG